MNAPIDISTVTLKTDRLLLRPWRENDLQDFYDYASVDGVGQMAGWTPHKNLEESQRILAHFIEQKKTFALEYCGKVIGSLGIEAYNEEDFPELAHISGREIGYVLSKEYWGQGLMPEAVKAVIEYLFDTVKLDFIMVGHFDWNHQSARVIEKCGFQYIKSCPFETHYGTVENSKESILYRSRYLRNRSSAVTTETANRVDCLPTAREIFTKITELQKQLSENFFHSLHHFDDALSAICHTEDNEDKNEQIIEICNVFYMREANWMKMLEIYEHMYRDLAKKDS